MSYSFIGRVESRFAYIRVSMQFTVSSSVNSNMFHLSHYNVYILYLNAVCYKSYASKSCAMNCGIRCPCQIEVDRQDKKNGISGVRGPFLYRGPVQQTPSTQAALEAEVSASLSACQSLCMPACLFSRLHVYNNPG